MNSRIGLIGQNSIEYIELILKIWNNGDSIALIDWRTPFETVLHLLDEAHVTTCYIEKSVYQNYSTERPKRNTGDGSLCSFFKNA